MTAPQKREPSWNDDQLADDVATISYEQALHTHARARPGASEAQSDAETLEEDHAPSKRASAHTMALKPLKTASITIRLSETECARLRARATEAGLTVSAYLRFCALEVESLRAQVKRTLAELRDTAAKPELPKIEMDQTGRPVRFVEGVKALFRRLVDRHRPSPPSEPCESILAPSVSRLPHPAKAGSEPAVAQ